MLSNRLVGGANRLRANSPRPEPSLSRDQSRPITLLTPKMEQELKVKIDLPEPAVDDLVSPDENRLGKKDGKLLGSPRTLNLSFEQT